MDLSELQRALGVADTPDSRRAQKLVDEDARMLDELIRIRHKRMTQDEVAERMGITQSAVARIEAGDRDPRLSTLRRYALAVGAVVSHKVVDARQPVLRLANTPGEHEAEDAAWPEPETRVYGTPRKACV